MILFLKNIKGNITEDLKLEFYNIPEDILQKITERWTNKSFSTKNYIMMLDEELTDYIKENYEEKFI